MHSESDFLGFFGLPALIERKTLVFNNVILAYSFANIVNFLLKNICLTFLDHLIENNTVPSIAYPSGRLYFST